MTEPFVLVV